MEERRKVKAALREYAEGVENMEIKTLLSTVEGTVYPKLYQTMYMEGLTIEGASKWLYMSPRTITRLLERFYLLVWAVLRE